MKKWMLTYIMTFMGCLITTAGINAFFIPHHLLSIGMSGIAIMVYYLAGMPIGITLFIMNIPILIVCYKFMGRSYTFISIYGTMLFSFFADMTAPLTTYGMVQDPLLSTIAGGISTGIGMGMMYRYNGNSGGTDVIAAIIQKFYSMEMGSATMGMNAVIVACAAYIFNLQLAILTLVGVYISGIVTNKVVIGLNLRKTVVIMSENPDEIAESIIRQVGRGVTLLYGQGGYTNEERTVVYTAIKLTEVSRVKEIVRNIDPKAFMIISSASNIFGQGFTMPLNKPYVSKEAALSGDKELYS